MAKKEIKIKKKKWDDIMVISVMVFSALCIFIMLGSFITTSGQASYIAQFSTQASLNTAVTLEGDGNCNAICQKVGKSCILATKNGNLGKCDSQSKAITCSCIE